MSQSSDPEADRSIHINTSRLANLIENSFSMDDINSLCFAFKIKYENIPGNTIQSKSRELVIAMENRNRLDDLIDECEKERPYVDWQTIYEENTEDDKNQEAFSSDPQNKGRKLLLMLIGLIGIAFVIGIASVYYLNSIMQNEILGESEGNIAEESQLTNDPIPTPTTSISEPEQTPTILPTPTNTPDPLPTIQPTEITNNPIPDPSPTAQPTQKSDDTLLSIALTEIMGNPCGLGMAYENAYEYIELFNYGDKSVDISGLWFTDNGNDNPGHPDKLVSWAQRYPFLELGENLILDSTILEPGQYAIVLAPLYLFGILDSPPYEISPNTVIMTIEESSDKLGDDGIGIAGSTAPLDVIVLYTGTEDKIHTIISTYGSPSINSDNPLDIRNEELLTIPFFLDDCVAAHRILASGPDIEQNWTKDLGSPGSSLEP